MSPSAEKIALFRRLFAGRPDVFPVRWENRKTAKSGYAPACANEWFRGICGKPRVKCGECPHQAFIPVTDDIIEKHLRGGNDVRASDGDFVAGVYPLLPDETCWFLAADFQERLILATGRYLGEGFDDPRLDTLFLTMPISWKGTLAQYIGRLHRQHAGKTEVLVVDYVDELVPVLARMATKRRLGYRALGYTVESCPMQGTLDLRASENFR